MKVRFADDVLDMPDAWKELDMIVYDHFAKKRHEWDIPNPNVVQKSRWFVENAQSHWTKTNRDILRKSVEKSIYRVSNGHSLRLTVSAVAVPPMTLQPADAKDVLDLPVHVVVENAESDRAFLDALIQAFSRTILRTSLNKGWCVVVSAGGCGEIVKRVKELVKKVQIGPRRILVFADSDRLIPDSFTTTPTKTAPMRVLEECHKEYHVEVILLQKREIENYLPLEALEGCAPEKKHVLKAFTKLNRAQRDHYDMKNGFSDKDGNFVILTEQEAFYESVDQSILRDLHTGFGDKVWKLFEETDDIINKTTLCATCPDDPGEFERILDTIESLL